MKWYGPRTEKTTGKTYWIGKRSGIVLKVFHKKTNIGGGYYTFQVIGLFGEYNSAKYGDMSYDFDNCCKAAEMWADAKRKEMGR